MQTNAKTHISPPTAQGFAAANSQSSTASNSIAGTSLVNWLLLKHRLRRLCNAKDPTCQQVESDGISSDYNEYDGRGPGHSDFANPVILRSPGSRSRGYWY